MSIRGKRSGKEVELKWQKLPERPMPRRSAKEEQSVIDKIEPPRVGAEVVLSCRDKQRTVLFRGTTMPAKASWLITDARGRRESIAVNEISKWAYADGS
jgi:hypothetical protein